MTVEVNFGVLVRDARFSQYGQFFREDYNWVRRELKDLSDKTNSGLPENFFEKGVTPLLNFLEYLGQTGFNKIFSSRTRDLSKEEIKQLDYYEKTIPQVVDALLQRSHGVTYGASKSFTEDLNAFQVAVTGVYQNVDFGGSGRLAPLVKWDHVTLPHTIISLDCKKQHPDLENVNFGVVALPVGNKFGGLISWGLIGHEVAGHLLFVNHPELLQELKVLITGAVKDYWEEEGLATKKKKKALGVWERWTEELVCDILGILVLGPPSVLCSLAFFRAISPEEKLSNVACETAHPPDILRVKLGVEFLKKLSQLSAGDFSKWNAFLEAEIEKDMPKSNVVEISCYGSPIEYPLQEVISIGASAIDKIALTRLNALNRSLVGVVNWTEEDFALINSVQIEIEKGVLSEKSPSFFSSRHVISGAIIAALETNNSVEDCFIEMKKYLAKKYHTTPFLGQDPKKFGLQ